jgi:murein DD-endopeptidase MepM/ murein hydrolase activator NlpD
VRTPGPLDNLPRPLSEREGRRGRRLLRRLVTLIVIGSVVVGGLVVVSSMAPPAIAPVGAVAGAVATPRSVPSPTSGVAAPADPVRSARADRAQRFAAMTARGARALDAKLVLRAGWLPRPTTPENLTGYRWPLPHGRITLPFGPSPWGSRLVEGSAFHDGLDLATFCGDRVVAAHDGTVLAAGRRFDAYMGWIGDLSRYSARLDHKHLWMTLPIVVIVDDGNGYRSIYAHFGKAVVKRGATVLAGQLLGYEGATGRASRCHHHNRLFSPLESARFAMEPDVMKRMKIPAYQIARVDPLRVLPPR